MVNTEEFVSRLEKVLAYYALSASSFADKIGVQRSSISHLLSGRNKPSLEFVMKVVQSFPEVNLYWLLNGKGSFPAKKGTTNPVSPITSQSSIPDNLEKSIVKILVLYSDGSFDAYDQYPSPK